MIKLKPKDDKIFSKLIEGAEFETLRQFLIDYVEVEPEKFGWKIHLKKTAEVAENILLEAEKFLSAKYEVNAKIILQEQKPINIPEQKISAEKKIITKKYFRKKFFSKKYFSKKCFDKKFADKRHNRLAT